jgi:hypothetical protein
MRSLVATGRYPAASWSEADDREISLRMGRWAIHALGSLHIGERELSYIAVQSLDRIARLAPPIDELGVPETVREALAKQHEHTDWAEWLRGKTVEPKPLESERARFAFEPCAPDAQPSASAVFLHGH